MKPKVCSLFSWVWGSSLGYKMAWCDVIWSIEFLNYQAHNYRLNHKTTKLFETDIRELKVEDFMKELNIKKWELDILDWSPPCSSFSMAGKREKLWGKQKAYWNKVQRTDDLFFQYVRFVKWLNPKVFVAENVAWLASWHAKWYLKDIMQQLKSLWYNVKAKILNSSNYWVAQIRRRIIIIGVRTDLNKEPIYPTPKEKKVTLIEVFEWLINTEEDLKEVDIKKYAIYNEAIKLKELESSKKYFSLVKTSPNSLAPTLTQMAGVLSAASIIHWDNRKFTVKEAKRITSFPDDFILEWNYSQKIEACWRTVPPLMMKEIALTIKNNILWVH